MKWREKKTKTDFERDTKRVGVTEMSGETDPHGQDEKEVRPREERGKLSQRQRETEIQRGCGGDDREGRKGGRDGRQRGMAVYLSSQIN